ncbi:MAG: DinB family protein [Phycisphaerales bacterium]|nr:DinB family protein [Phycisphaerales bacterium]
MGAFADSITHAAKRSRTYAERLLKDVRPDQFARKPIVAGVPIDTNHPAFVYGHLALYPAKIAQMIGKDIPGIASPPGHEDLFKNGAPCQDDPLGTIYPGMDTLTRHYFNAYDTVIAAVSTLPDDIFARETPDPRYREFMPLVGSITLFLLNNHVMVHLGQISAWRRCMGLGAA